MQIKVYSMRILTTVNGYDIIILENEAGGEKNEQKIY